MSAGDKLLSYKPGAFYYRTAARQTDDPVVLRALVDLLSEEYEAHRQFIREAGLWPPVARDPMAVVEELLGRRVDERQLALALLPDPDEGTSGRAG